MSKQSVKIGPEMPDLPMVKAEPSPEPQDTQVADSPSVETVKQTINGLVVETIVSIEKPRSESQAALKARVKESHTDIYGNLVETY